MKTFIFLFLSTFTFAQIGSKVQSSKPVLVGNWSNSSFGFEMKLVLNSDGSGSFDGEKITYSSTATTLIIKEDGITTTYQYKLNGNSLMLSGGDLDAPITFTKNGGGSPVTSSNNTKTSVSKPNSSASVVGTWSGNGETMILNSGGKGSYNGVPFSYQTSGDNLIITGSTGTSTMQYSVSGNNLVLSGNGTTVILQKGTAYSGNTQNGNYSQNSGGYTNNSSGGGSIDQSIVGKWCWVSSLNNTNATSSSSRCIVINGNGTYEYYAEGSISGYGGGGYGGSASQSADRGTWKLAGNRIYVQSQAEGYKIYSFEKRNHPKNGDPMIIIDGDPYVTYYQKAPWR